MSILGIGVDLVHVPRITSLLIRRGPMRLAARILSLEELSHWESLSPDRRTLFLAVRWGVKEAAYKALHPVVRVTWKELTYRSLGKGHKPTLLYQPVLLEESAKVGRIHVSVSHDGDNVFTTVIVENAPVDRNK